MTLDSRKIGLKPVLPAQNDIGRCFPAVGSVQEGLYLVVVCVPGPRVKLQSLQLRVRRWNVMGNTVIQVKQLTTPICIDQRSDGIRQLRVIEFGLLGP